MASVIRKILLVLVLCSISQVYCCQWDKDKTEVQFDNLVSGSVRRQDTWFYLTSEALTYLTSLATNVIQTGAAGEKDLNLLTAAPKKNEQKATRNTQEHRR
ncbi:hypothetical protein CBL_09189 [Carabus blaptoides fortunei]